MNSDRLTQGVPLIIYTTPSASPLMQKCVLSLTFGVLALTGGAFVVKGAWPVAVMTTMTGGALTSAFSLSNRKARQKQTLLLDGPLLHVDTLLPYHQRPTRVSLQSGWTRAQMAPENSAVQPKGPDSLLEVTERLCLTDGKYRVYIGDFLPPEERPALKAVIETGLRAHGNAFLRTHP